MLKRVIYCLFLSLLSGCETTGDPTTGGLYGWSEEKAKQRQAQLNRRVVDIEAQMNAIEEENQELESDKVQLTQLIVIQSEKLNALIASHDALLGKIETYKGLERINQTKISQLKTRYPWLGLSREEVLRQFQEAASESRQQQMLNQLESELESLAQEIDMIL
ncbi:MULTISPECIES: hypothetical protein [Pseudoalteromonas]|uniref:hypothetical protein n=1 Tax=Pseudoalteromonas TaxID=53246 RepID=UPI000FFEE074|nr:MULTISPECIES: hypothetical protein [Pseudoalteromonas]MCG7540150.1 hypothetical protein [Pseudoalteromonas sp. OF7H-1]MCG9761657.1 hypothetical protein [Pseudoalteromonas sp. Isolate6]NKC21225.1 hypothetical protein [Pseudoalteromonas galatheae]QZO15101.1 hypothetical protein K5642_22840 [Pseudoalteromonas piscicida]RXE86024.1 hypothetical protein DRB05_13985 [Pseudoalteromonas sp. A757]